MKNKSKKMKQGIFMTAVVGAMMVAPYVADGLGIQTPFENKASAFEGGTGTATDPFLVSTTEQFLMIKSGVSSHYKLVSDIDFKNQLVTPIDSFAGRIDGNGYSIKNVLMVSSVGQDFGLIKSLTGTIENIRFENINIENTATGKTGNIGAVAGTAKNATLRNITIQNSSVLTQGGKSIGTFIGSTSGNTTISNILGKRMSIESPAERVGGFLGESLEQTNIKNIDYDVDVKFTGVLSTMHGVGGFIGLVIGASAYQAPNPKQTNTHENIIIRGSVDTTKTQPQQFAVGGFYGNVSKGVMVNNVFLYSDLPNSAYSVVGFGYLANLYLKGIYMFQDEYNGGFYMNGDYNVFASAPYSSTDFIVSHFSIKNTPSSWKVTHTFTEAQKKESLSYIRNGLSLGEEKSEFGIIEGSTMPYLLFKDAPLQAADSGVTNSPSEVELATDSVINAESMRTQEAVNDALKLVNALPESAEKNNLINRLDAVQAELDLKSDEELYEFLVQKIKQIDSDLLDGVIPASRFNETKNLLDTYRAQGNTLKDFKKKEYVYQLIDNIINNLNALSENGNWQSLPESYIKAEKAVENAEKTIKQIDVDAARQLVDLLIDGSKKDTLNARLDVVQENINNSSESLLKEVEESVAKAESTKAKDDLDVARKKVNEVDSKKYPKQVENWNARLDAIQKIIDDKSEEDKLAQLILDANNKVEKAESNILKEDIDDAQKAIDVLPNGAEKDLLQDRLNEVKDKYSLNLFYNDAEKAVAAAESNGNASTIANAQTKIDKVSDKDARKEGLQERLNVVLQNLYKFSEELVIQAESSKLKSDVSKAKDSVNKLPAGEVKQALLSRIAAIEAEIVSQEKADVLYEEALRYLEKAEQNSTTPNIVLADSKIQKVLVSDPRKETLNQRLSVLLDKLAINEATKAVELVEQMYTANRFTDAQNKVSALKDSNFKTALQERLNTISTAQDNIRYKEALNAVDKAEKLVSRDLVIAAQQKVDVLQDSSRKSELQERLDAVLKEIERLENLNGKFEYGDDIVEIANTVKDEAARKYFVEWATAIVNDEKTFTKANTTTVSAKEKAVPVSISTIKEYKTLVDELQARTDVLEGCIANFNFLHYSFVSTALKDVRAFEINPTQETKAKATSSIDSMKAKEKNNAGISDKLVERVNRINF